jgi:hypothetical protein
MPLPLEDETIVFGEQAQFQPENMWNWAIDEQFYIELRSFPTFSREVYSS